MERTLGRGGPVVSRVGLGLAALGRPGYINVGHGEDLAGARTPEALERRAHEVMDAAWAGGVRYFDAARSYGRAEAFLASWLAARGRGRADVVVGSKWGYTYTAAWQVEVARHEVKDHSLANFLRQRDETWALLGGVLSLYQVHSATFESGVLEDAAVLSALAELLARGVRVGLSLSGASQGEVLRRALEVRVDGRPLFSCVQATWNLLEPSCGPALAEAHALGWGVIVKEALANGRLLRGAQPELSALAREQGVGEDAVALAAVLAQPWADVVLSGAATVAQLRSNLREGAVALGEDVLERLLSRRQAPDAYWEARAALPWS